MATLPERFRRVPVREIASGLNDNTNPVMLRPGESPELANVDLDRDTIAHAGGSVKFGNQTAPRPGLLVGKRSSATMPVMPGKSVPIRGYAFLPYSEKQDALGSDYTVDVKTGVAAPINRSFARQRGKSFDIQQSFRIPQEEKFFSEDTRGALTSVAAGSAWDMKFGFDQALDEFFALWQKGGDHLAPMSWALGVVNTGKLFDTDVGGGLNIFGLSTATYAKRRSNYALCFIWLDVPAFGVDRPACARYRLSNGSVWFDEAGHPTAADGAYPSFAYRAMIIPFFVEPGDNVRVALRLSLDTGSAGTTWTAATGQLAGVAWNGDGSIDWRVQRNYDAVENFTSANGASGQVLRYKGPSDSLEYFCKYGVRYHGRDAHFVGLGMRFSSWAGGGFIPFGIDSAPVEAGGHSITDLSVHAPLTTLYGDLASPEEEPSAVNTTNLLYDLRIEYDPAIDPTGTKFGISEIGLVRRNGGYAGHTWGNETTRWANIASQGKQPWGPYNLAWAGLGALTGTGFNPEALKSYRLVFGQDNAGFAANTSCGGMLSLDTYVATAFGAYSFAQHVTCEGGDQFLGANPTLAAAAGRWMVLVRAFRWNQRSIVVSELRMYSKPRTWNVQADRSLSHEIDMTLTSDPGLDNLVACWTFADGGGTQLEELVHGNTGMLAPLAGSVLEDGGCFLSGEGEALYLNLAENPDFREQLRASQADPKNGIAIQIAMRLPEASYAIGQRVNTEIGLGGGSSYYRGKFPSVLAAWDFGDTDRHSDVLAEDASGSVNTNEIDHVGGFFQRPQPALEFGQNIYVENNVGGTEPFAYPMGFSLRTRGPLSWDQRLGTLAVPGAGATGLHAWWNNAGTNVSRWDKFASWAGKEIVVQFGLQPTSNPDEFIPYIAAWPKEFLSPATNDPANAEFAYFASTTTIYRGQAERAVIVIGGALNPRQLDYRNTTSNSWLSLARSVHESSARVIVQRVSVFGAAAPGALPSVSGNFTPAGTGKIVGDNPLALSVLEASDLLTPIASGGTPVNFTQGSALVKATGSSVFSQALAEQSKFAVLRTFLVILGDKLTVPVEGSDFEEWQRSYWVSVAAAQQLTLARPIVGATRKASAASSFRVVGYTAFQDSEVPPLTIGAGGGYDLSLVTTRDVHLTAAMFENLAPPAAPWRFRVYSSIPSGIGRSLLPSWVRGANCSTWNSIQGLHGIGEKLYAGAQSSLFEADDRWRDEGPSSALAKSIALRSRLVQGVRLPLESDRIVFTDSSLVRLSTMLLEAAVAYLGFFDAWVKLDSLEGLQTILWCGRLDSDPGKNAGTHGVQFWLRLADGYPELVIGCTDTSGGSTPSRALFVARGARRLPVGVFTHVRFTLQGVDAATDSAGLPTLWVQGKRVSLTRNATGDAASAGTWASLASLVWDGSHALVLGAARDARTLPVVSNVFTVAANAQSAPLLPQDVRGFVHSFEGELAGIVVGRANNATGFNAAEDFDPFAINYDQVAITRRFAVLERDQDHYGVGHKCYDAARPQWGIVYSHPLISISHAMGGLDVPWSFATSRDEIFCANGGRVGIINSKDNSFRHAGIRAPLSKPKVQIVRQPLWKDNLFVPAGDVENDPIFGLSIDNAGAPTSSTPAAVARVKHYSSPGTMMRRQKEDAAMTWAIDKFFCWKGYIRMRSVGGRQCIYSRRGSLTSGGPFLEIRDGFLVLGWYDTELKEEVTIQTSAPVIEPGFVYYVYVRKWFPRGGLATGNNALYTKPGSNWANSIHVGLSPTNQQCYDSLIWRRVPKAVQSAFDDFTGYDLKSYDKDTDATAGFGGAANYAYVLNGSSARACVSATAADSQFTSDPYTQAWSGTGYVIFNAAILNTAFKGDNNGRIQLAAGAGPRFVADHVGMLLQINGGTLTGQVYRITEFVSATTVICIARDGTPAPFGAVNPVTDTLSVFMGVSLVKSANFDRSKNPDPALYAVEEFGSSLQTDSLNGITPFDGEAWSVAYDVVAGENGGGAGEVPDGGGNLVTLPNIFESATGVNIPTPPVAASIASCACEIGTDVFGLQGTANTRAGKLPFQGEPLGELCVDNTFAHTAIDTHTYFSKPAAMPYVLSNSAPSSTQPNALLETALDASARSVDKPVWTKLAPVIEGTRVARIAFFDRKTDTLGEAGELFSFHVPVEDTFNPSASAKLVLSDLPPCPDDRAVSTRIYFSQAGAQVLFLRTQIDDTAPNSVSLAIDEVNATALGVLDTSFLGVPPDSRFVATSQDRMWYGNLKDQEDGLALSLAFYSEIVPASNVFAVNTGKSAITALREHQRALVVFKRDCIIPYKVESGQALAQRYIYGEGCESNASIAALEDRLYFVSDRGPCAMIDNWQPFFLGRLCQEFFKSKIDKASLGEIHGALNRRRNQYVFTVKERTRAKMDRRFSVEFKHPSAGEDLERAEMAGGHRVSYYHGPSCTALGSVLPRGGGPALLVGGTEHGFVVWLDRSDARTELVGPSFAAGAETSFGARTLTAAALQLTGELDGSLEGPMGLSLRAYVAGVGELERYVLFAKSSGGQNYVFLDGPFQEATAWLLAQGVAVGDVVSLGGMLFRYSTKSFDGETVELEKQFYYLDVTRRATSGNLKLDLFKDGASVPVGPSSIDVDLTRQFFASDLQRFLQRTRVARFLFRTQTPTVDQDVELVDIVLRLQDTDPR